MPYTTRPLDASTGDSQAVNRRRLQTGLPTSPPRPVVLSVEDNPSRAPDNERLRTSEAGCESDVQLAVVSSSGRSEMTIPLVLLVVYFGMSAGSAHEV